MFESPQLCDCCQHGKHHLAYVAGKVETLTHGFHCYALGFECLHCLKYIDGVSA